MGAVVGVRRTVGVLTGAAVLGGALAALLASGPAAAAGPPARCDEQSWIAGSVDLCDGALVYRDYLYDDHGADNGTPGSSPGRLSRPSGDERHPAGQESTTDLVDLTLRLAGDRVEVVAELAAVYEPGTAVVALAVDRDDDRATGGGPWVQGARVLDVRSTGWDELHLFDRADPATNEVRGSFPVPAGDRWRLQAVVARADTGNVMQVAFRGTDEQASADFVTTYLGRAGSWFEDRQAAALRTGDVSAFGHVVEVQDLRRRVTRPAPLVPGFHERVYTSAHTLPPGEGWSETKPVPPRQKGGIANQGGYFPQAFHFFGRYQPYGVYVPRSTTGPYGLQLAVHGYNANHSSLVNQPGFQQRFGEELGRIVVVPLGRGPHGFMSDIAERDALDVLADVQRVYDVDPDRVFAGGYSAGGYSALRLATLFPDRFAGLVNWVGFVGDTTASPAGNPGLAPAGAIGYPLDLLGSLRHVPSAHLYGASDELEPVPNQLALRQELLESESVFEQFTHAPPTEHFTFGILDDWRKEAAYTKDLRRVTRPARVTYRTDEVLGNAELGIRHDRAYWLSELRGRGPGYVDVDATSSGCGGSVAETAVDRRTGTDPTPWVSDRRTVTGQRPLAAEPRLVMRLGNVTSVSVDAVQTCLVRQAIAYEVVTDGPATVAVDGRTLSLPSAGTFTGVLGRDGRAVPTAGTSGPVGGAPRTTIAARLPATGADGAGALAAAVLLGGACATRRLLRLQRGAALD